MSEETSISEAKRKSEEANSVIQNYLDQQVVFKEVEDLRKVLDSQGIHHFQTSSHNQSTFTLHCYFGGKRREQHKPNIDNTRSSNSKKINCSWKLNLNKKFGGWVITSFRSEHNHGFEDFEKVCFISNFCFILFYFILFYFILFYFILFYFIFILFYFILFYFILFYFILFYFYFILFYFILFYLF